MKFIRVTPNMAKSWLSKNSRNRSVRAGHVRRLAADMMHGRWRDDLCPPIILGPDDEVVDGQHRLHAIIVSNVEISLEVRRVQETTGYGLPIDVGILRNPKDLLLRTAKAAEVVGVCARIMTGNTKPSREDLIAWDAVIGDAAQRLHERSGGVVRIMSTAPVRAGFCIASMTVASDLGEDVVFDAYADLKGARLETSPIESLGPLYRRLLGDNNTGYPTMVLRCWLVIEAFRRRDAMVIRKLGTLQSMVEDIRRLLIIIADNS